MINVRKLVNVARIADTSSGGLAMTFKRNTFSNVVSRTKLYKEEEKLQKLREDTFSALSKTLGEKGKKGGLSGALMGALGIGGTGRVIRRFGGGGGGGLRGGGGAPKLPKGPLAKSLSKFGRIGPLAIASTGLDFFSRKQSGQSNLQAGGGALAGLGGFAGGAKLGAMLGTAIMPGAGTAVGGLLGGAVGGLMGGNIFDRLYGQNTLGAGADFRRIQELERTRQGKTLFGENLDKLDVVLDKFETTSTQSKFDPNFESIVGSISAMLFGISPKKKVSTQTPAFMRLIDTLFNAAVVVIPQAKPVQLTWKQIAKNLIVSKKARKTSGFLKFSKDASKIKPETLVERMTRAFEKNFGKSFKPALSKKGLEVRKRAKANKIIKDLRKDRIDQKKVDKIIEEATTTVQGEAAKRTVGQEGLLDLINKTDLPKDILKPGFDKNLGRVRKRYVKQFKKKTNENQSPVNFDNLKNEEGGEMTGPETGYLAVLHGKERVIPVENRHTRSKGQAQGMKQNIFIFQDSNGGNDGNTQSQQVMKTPKTQMVPIVVPADPFDVATKYSELIAKVTV